MQVRELTQTPNSQSEVEPDHWLIKSTATSSQAASEISLSGRLDVLAC